MEPEAWEASMATGRGRPSGAAALESRFASTSDQSDVRGKERAERLAAAGVVEDDGALLDPSSVMDMASVPNALDKVESKRAIDARLALQGVLRRA